jgi:hypothetical protein
VDLESAIGEGFPEPLLRTPESDLSRTKPTGFLDDGAINELLRLAGVSTADARARRWLESALAGARDTLDPRRVPRPSPTKHNLPLEKIERASNRLITTLEQLRRHPHAHRSFWSFAAFGPVHDSKFERAGVTLTLTTVRDAARKGRVSKTGRPRNVRKQQVVDLALGFCARCSLKRPSSDVKNFFPAFAERFFELSTGSSVGEVKGIGRQIKVALKRLPGEMERAALLNKSRPK